MSDLFNLDNIKNIPEELKAQKIWINWRERPGEPKPRKVPCRGMRRNEKTGHTLEPMRYREAIRAVRQSSGNLGLGVYVGPCGGSYLVGLDVDKVTEETIRRWRNVPIKLRRILDPMDTYIEVSPNGKGIHALGLCSKEDAEALEEYSTRSKGGEFNFELYSKGKSRFLTFTGTTLNGTLNLDTGFPEFAKAHMPIKVRHNEHAVDENPDQGLSVADFIDRMDKTFGGDDKAAATKCFWEGEYPDDVNFSSWEQGFFNDLAFWLGPNPERIREAFFQSPYYHKVKGERDDKLTKRQDYLDRTIAEAINTQQNFYSKDDVVPEGDGEAGAMPEKQLDTQKNLLGLLPKLPAIMQDVHKHMLACSPYPQPIFCMFSTLFLFGAMINRYTMIENLGPNMQIKLLGLTGSGKDLPIKYPAQVLRDLQATFVLDEVTSAAGLEDSLFENDGNAVRITDEDRALAAGLTSEFTLKLSDYESKIYSAVGGTIVQRARSSGSVAKQYDPIANPFYAKLSAATPGASFNDTSWARALSGEGSRTLYILTKFSRPKRKSTPEPVKALPQVEDWYAEYLPEIPIGEAVKPRRMKFTTDAHELLEKALDDIDRELRIPHLEEIERALLARIGEYGKRFAMVYALADNPRVKRINAEWAQLGIDTALCYYGFSKQFMIKELMTRRPQIKHTDHVQVLEKLQHVLKNLNHYMGLPGYAHYTSYLKKKWVPRTMLVQLCGSVDKRSMDSIRDTLVDYGAVKEVSEKLLGKRKATVVWKLSAHHNG